MLFRVLNIPRKIAPLRFYNSSFVDLEPLSPFFQADIAREGSMLISRDVLSEGEIILFNSISRNREPV